MRRALIALVLWQVAVLGAAGKDAPVDVPQLLMRLGEFVSAYYGRAQSVICDETVRLQSLRPDLMSDDEPPRRLLFELRVAWEPSDDGGVPEANVLRTLVSVNNRRPREKDRDGCMDPRAVSPEPLGIFLPANQHDYIFTADGRGKSGGRPAIILEYRSRERGPISATRRDDCFSIELPGRTRGRAWIDEETYEVLRIDEHLTGMFDVTVPPDPKRRDGPSVMVVERLDTSIVYKRVTFTDPDETLILPASQETVTVVRNSGTPRLRTSQTFRNYRRFITGIRIVQ